MSRDPAGREDAPSARARRAGPSRAGAWLIPALAWLAATPLGASPSGEAFGAAPGFAGVSRALAVAVASDGRVAVGAQDGVWLGRPPGAARRVLRRAPVLDLLFEADGTLLVATARGLFSVAADGRVVDLGPGPGASARQVRRVAAFEGLRLAATAGGIFAGEGRLLQRLDAQLPSGDATALAVLGSPADGGDLVLYAILDGELWRARLAEAQGRWKVAHAARQALEGVAAPPLDLLHDPARGLLLLTDRDLAIFPESGELEVRRLELPPGALPRRLVRAAGELWIASDGGLLRLVEEPGAGPLRARRAAPPAGSVAAHDVAAGVGRLWVASARGLLAAALGSPPPGPSASGASGASGGAPAREARPDALPGVAQAAAREPSVQAVQRAALAWLDLGPGPIRSLRRRAGRRGWLPTLELRGRYEGSRGKAHETDEAFTGGALRRLHDLDRDRDRGFDTQVVLRWDLGATVFDPEEVDVAKEAREVIELRDEVLDEVNQLYYERRRVLLDASTRAEGDPERARLALRAAELGAGLDAWTGGWWSRQRDAPALPISSPARSPEPSRP